MMEIIESYVVRIYRRDKDAPRNIIGLVEDVGLQETRPFHNTDELAEILIAPHPDPLPKGERGKRKGRRRRSNRLKKQIKRG